jgi:hypothetical protein
MKENRTLRKEELRAWYFCPKSNAIKYGTVIFEWSK